MSLKLYKYVVVNADVNDPETTASGTTADAAAVVEGTTHETVGSYVESLIKLIPGEVIITYPILKLLVASLPSFTIKESVSGLISVFLTIALRSFALGPNERPQVSALILSITACVIWIYQQGGSILFEIPIEWKSAIDIVLIVFILIGPRLVKREVRIL